MSKSPQPWPSLVLEYHRRWKAERWSHVRGFITEYIYRSEKHSGECIGAAVFVSKEVMVENGKNPADDALYQQFRALLQDDPEWEDVEIIFVY